jgi:hypothetical protein
MIYFIQAGKNGPIKIGKTDNEIENRIRQLQIGCPYELKLLWLYKDDDYSEAEIHETFAHERIRGEWFHPTKKLLEFINDKCANTYEILTQSENLIVIQDSLEEICIYTDLVNITLKEWGAFISATTSKAIIETHAAETKVTSGIAKLDRFVEVE